MKTGIELIAEERNRQISAEKFSYSHDDEHTEGELAHAAACYASNHDQLPSIKKGENYPPKWPWGGWWKPSPNNRIRELQKSGALIAAEIDRLQRLKQKQDGQQ